MKRVGGGCAFWGLGEIDDDSSCGRMEAGTKHNW